jgi:hypothetical protein
MGYARGDPLRGHSEALTYWRDAGNARWIAYALLYLGAIEFRQGHGMAASPAPTRLAAMNGQRGGGSALPASHRPPSPSRRPEYVLPPAKSVHLSHIRAISSTAFKKRSTSSAVL